MENNRELMLLVEAVAKEKGLPKNEILSFLAEGIEVAVRKNFPEGSLVQVDIDNTSGEIQAWRLYELVDQIENVEAQMLHNEVEDEEVYDGYVWEKFTPKLNRQQFNITKQVALQKIKNQARDQIISDMLARPVNLYNGVVKVLKKDSLIVDYAGNDIIIPHRNLLPKEKLKIGEKIKFTLIKDGEHYFGSRISEKFLTELFKEEISAIEDGDIEIIACVRNPGLRSKIIVRSLTSKMEAARLCIGSKGVHIKNIQQEIPGEFIDIIEYNSDPAQLLIKAIEPAAVTHIVIDEDQKSMEIAVEDKDIALAIGRSGKNIDMISKLIGWNIKVFSDENWNKKQAENDIGILQYFIFALDCDEDLSQYLIDCGHSSIEEIAYLSSSDLCLDDLDDATISALKQNAKDTLANPDKLKQANALQSLFTLGFSSEEVEALITNNILTNEDVADLSTYDLQDIIPNIDLSKAKDIIIKSRQNLEE